MRNPAYRLCLSSDGGTPAARLARPALLWIPAQPADFRLLWEGSVSQLIAKIKGSKTGHSIRGISIADAFTRL